MIIYQNITYSRIYGKPTKGVSQYIQELNINKRDLILICLKLMYSKKLQSNLEMFCREYICFENKTFCNDFIRLYRKWQSEQDELIKAINSDVSLSVIGVHTVLELLKIIFSIDADNTATELDTINREQYIKFEQEFFKVILLVNGNRLRDDALTEI